MTIASVTVWVLMVMIWLPDGTHSPELDTQLVFENRGDCLKIAAVQTAFGQRVFWCREQLKS